MYRILTFVTFLTICESVAVPLSYLCTASNTIGVCLPNIQMMGFKYPRYVYDIQTMDDNTTVIETTPVLDDSTVHMHKYRCYPETEYTRCISMQDGHQIMLHCTGNDEFKLCTIGMDPT